MVSILGRSYGATGHIYVYHLYRQVAPMGLRNDLSVRFTLRARL
jgi:hypothetical protein